MSTPTVPLSVAIYENPTIKHWGLFIETEDDHFKATVHVVGARQRYFATVRRPSDARNVIEILPLCHIDASKIETVERIALGMHVRNEDADYSCQDYVLDLLKVLEEQGIIDSTDANYTANKDAVIAKRESWP